MGQTSYVFDLYTMQVYPTEHTDWVNAFFALGSSFPTVFKNAAKPGERWFFASMSILIVAHSGPPRFRGQTQVFLQTVWDFQYLSVKYAALFFQRA